MSKGKAKSTLLGIQGIVGHQTAPDWSFLYEVSTIKNAHYNIGDHVKLPDGREFIYAKSSGACISGQGCEFTAVGVNAYQALLVAQAIGDKQVTVPACTHSAAFAEDELRGGYALIYDGSTNNVQFRGIIGNDASTKNSAFVIYLDAALTEAVVASTSAIEVFENPYSGLRTGTSDERPIAGVPARKVTASGRYFWVQKNGPVWVAPQGGVNDRDIGSYWRHDGSLQDTETVINHTLSGGETSQYAGHLIEGEEDDIGPLFMLQG